MIDVFEMKNPDTRHIHVPLNPEIERNVTAINRVIKGDQADMVEAISSFSLADTLF